MSFDHDVEANLNTYGGRIVENKVSLTGSGVPRSMMVKRLYEQLAVNLAYDAVTTTEDKYSVTHDLRVYVLTPEQLEKYVQRRAERLHPSMPEPRWVS